MEKVPETALEWFSENPGRWCQRKGMIGRAGNQVPYASGDAVAMCLGAASGFFHPDEPAISMALGRAREVIAKKWGHTGLLPSWNDAKERTIDDILYVCREARL